MSNQSASPKADAVAVPDEKPSAVHVRLPAVGPAVVEARAADSRPEYITPEQREVIAAAARRLGVVEAAKRLGISSEALLRVAGDFGSQPGTEALAAQRLGRLEG